MVRDANFHMHRSQTLGERNERENWRALLARVLPGLVRTAHVQVRNAHWDNLHSLKEIVRLKRAGYVGFKRLYLIASISHISN